MTSEPYLRKAIPEDIDILFQWANDETTRQNAFNPHKINHEEHKKWFNEKLNSDKTVIYVYCIDKTPIGQIRIDITDNIGLISYSIDSTHRKQGHGKKIIELLEQTLINELPNINKLIAKVKKTNIASQHIFVRLNYSCFKNVDYFVYEKVLK